MNLTVGTKRINITSNILVTKHTKSAIHVCTITEIIYLYIIYTRSTLIAFLCVNRKIQTSIWNHFFFILKIYRNQHFSLDRLTFTAVESPPSSWFPHVFGRSRLEWDGSLFAVGVLSKRGYIQIRSGASMSHETRNSYRYIFSNFVLWHYFEFYGEKATCGKVRTFRKEGIKPTNYHQPVMRSHSSNYFKQSDK